MASNYDKSRRVVITGMGALTPLGNTVEEFWQGCVEGRSGIDWITLFDNSAYPVKVDGEVRGFDPTEFIDRKEARRMARFSQLSVSAAKMAIEDSGLKLEEEDTTRIGVLLGNGNGGYPETDEAMRTIVSRGGLPLGVDFSGGTVLWLKFKQPVTEDQIRHALGPLSAEATVQTFGQPGDNEMMIRMPLRQGLEQGASLEADAKQVEASVRGANLGEFEVRNREIVGPTIGEDLKRKGIWATLTALGGILVYIALRFRLSFGIGAIVATFHDVLVTLVFLTWFGYELSLNVIAAILTITGYSVNDTIVIFDRVRENQRLARKEPLDETVNRAVNQTLSRTIITAGATFLAVLALFLFGGQVLRPMAFTLLVGVMLMLTANGNPFFPGSSPAQFVHFENTADMLEDIAAFTTTAFNYAGAEASARVAGAEVSEAYFRTFRAPFAGGRAFTREEMAPGGARVAVVSHAFWTRYLEGDPNIVGSTISLNGVSRRIR